VAAKIESGSAVNTYINTQTLVVGTHQNQGNGLKISPGITAIGQGGTSTTFNNSISLDGTNNNITITTTNCLFNTTNPPELANQPANGDNSNKIATTAWVLTNTGSGSGYVTAGGNNTFTGTNTFNNPVNIGNATGTNNAAIFISPAQSLVFNNNTNGGQFFFNYKDATTGNIANTVSIGSDGVSSGANLAGKSSFAASSSLTPAVLYMGVTSGSGTLNNIVGANDTYIIGSNGVDNGALTLSTYASNSSGSGGIRITKPLVDIRGYSISLNTTTTGGVTSTTTQPTYTDSSTSIPTTAWVQSVIANRTPLFLRAYTRLSPFSGQTTMGNISLNFSNNTGSGTLTINDSVTVRFSIRYDYNTASSNSSTIQSTYYKAYYGNMVIWPYRILNGPSPAVNVPLNGAFGTNTATNLTYGYTDPTLAPSGRFIWTDNYSFTTNYNATSPVDVAMPVYVTNNTTTSLQFKFTFPYTAASNAQGIVALSVYLELINTLGPDQQTAQVSSSGGLNGTNIAVLYSNF
jgi:hypothetical protein